MRRFFTSILLPWIAFSEISAEVMISEFLADNVEGIKDEDGNRQDWIELFNPGDDEVDLEGWFLTDDSSIPDQWRIPAVSIPAKGTLLIWASGKDRVDPGEPMHTNFSLKKSGEFLALYRPGAGDGSPELVDSFGPSYPPQAPDISYGVSISQNISALVASNEACRYRVLANDTTGAANYQGNNYLSGDIGTGLSDGWNVSSSFNDDSWIPATTGLGYDTSGGYNPWITTNCKADLRYENTSLCFRRTFSVADPATFVSFTLRMKYEDGFVAYLNGEEIARANFSGTPTYNSKATAALNEAIVNSWTEFDIPASKVQSGDNVLAIQGLNSSSGSSDFLLLPEITAAAGIETGAHVYFSEPTPNELNNAGSPGPVVFDASPADPEVTRPLGNSGSPPLKVTVKVIETGNPVATVGAIYRTMWNAESQIPLNDSGIAPDDVSGDGLYSGYIPTDTPAAGQMFRWRFEAVDSTGGKTRFPAYADPLDSPEYFGTVAQVPGTTSSQLSILEWFVEDSPANGPTASNFRGSCYYLNRFYDNIRHEIHGQSTSGFSKKSYDFDSNDNFRFVWKEGERAVKDLNLLSNYADKTKTRNSLAHEVAMMADTPYHFCFPVRVHLNGVFHGVMDLMEDGDDRMLDRNGLDGEGAFYKMYNDLSSTGGGEKKTRKDEDKTDLQALINGLNPDTDLASRRAYAYDNVNIPAAVNYMAVRTLNSDRDHGHKNYYVYRDTNGTGEWQPIIWDVDLSLGHNWTSRGYFDDTIYSDNVIRPSQIERNRLYQIIGETPEFRAMYVRRLRTLMDTIYEPPGTSHGLLETRMREIVASVDPDPAVSSWTDGDLDATRWGVWGRALWPREEVEYTISNHFEPRRAFLYNQDNATRQRFSLTAGSGDPIPDNAQSNYPGMLAISEIDFLPASGSQDEEYVILRNLGADAIDVSGWSLDGGISHVFEGGTVIPSGDGTSVSEYQGLLHVVRDAVAFRSRATGPTGGQKRLLQGNYSGQLSARGGTVNLRDSSGQLIASYPYAGNPTRSQQYLRVSEIQYHPANPDSGEQLAIPGLIDDDFEYLELMNTGPFALNITGAEFTKGIDFVFPLLWLAPGGRLVLAKNPVAFALRYPSTTVPVMGPYSGVLANGGERLKLTDAVGEVVLDFSYSDDWYPSTDGSGHALVHRDPVDTLYDDFGRATAWAISGDATGSPGSADAFFAQAYQGWDNFHFTALELVNPLISGPDADPDGDGRKNSAEYALATDPQVADLPVLEFMWSMHGATRLPALRFRRPVAALDVTYEVLVGSDLENWPVVIPSAAESHAMGGGIEEVVFRDSTGGSEPKRFLKLRYTLTP